MKPVNHKMMNNHGETIGEMLVSSLIIALAIVMLITMVNISARLVQKSEKNSTQFFSNINAAEESDDTGSKNAVIEITGRNDSEKFNVDIHANLHKLSGNHYSVTYKKAS